MRLWTLHPNYLDAQGLVALWREGLLAAAVLRGATRGYRHHPQLTRFRACSAPVAAIAAYLAAVADEADARGYRFDRSKLPASAADLAAMVPITANDGQLALEQRHLLAKLAARCPERVAALRAANPPLAHPLFRVVAGAAATWEKASPH